METITKHKQDCKMVFGRKDKTCPRCQELINGSPTRAGWQQSYYKNKTEEQARFTKQLKEHDCIKSNCGPVCTAFDW